MLRTGELPNRGGMIPIVASPVNSCSRVFAGGEGSRSAAQIHSRSAGDDQVYEGVAQGHDIAEGERQSARAADAACTPGR